MSKGPMPKNGGKQPKTAPKRAVRAKRSPAPESKALVTTNAKPLTKRQQLALAKAEQGLTVPKRGPLPWKPTKKERENIAQLVASGFSREQIAHVMGKSENTILKYCALELEAGDIIINGKIGGALFAKAMAGDVTAMIWWEKTRRGMSEKTIMKLEGGDNGPLVTQAITAKEAAERYKQKLG